MRRAPPTSCWPAAIAAGSLAIVIVACTPKRLETDRQLVTNAIYRIIRFEKTGHREEYMKAMDQTLAGLGPRAAPTLREIFGHDRNGTVCSWAAMYLYRYPGQETDAALLTGIEPKRGSDVVYACCEVLGHRILEDNLSISKDKVELAALRCLADCDGLSLDSVVTLIVDCRSRKGEDALRQELVRRYKEPMSRRTIGRGLWDFDTPTSRVLATEEAVLLRKEGHVDLARQLTDHISGIK